MSDDMKEIESIVRYSTSYKAAGKVRDYLKCSYREAKIITELTKKKIDDYEAELKRTSGFGRQGW